jgi:hypothetical protein
MILPNGFALSGVAMQVLLGKRAPKGTTFEKESHHEN